MATKTTKAGTASRAKPASSDQPDPALSISQDQLQALVGLTDVLFKGAEELRRFQMEAAHQARERYEQAQTEIAKARTPAELFDLQSELLRFDLETSGKYWQQIAAICAETQSATMGLLNRSAATVTGDLAKLVAQPLPKASTRPEAEAAAEPAPAGSDAANQVWNQWVDLGKQWTDMVYRTEAAMH